MKSFTDMLTGRKVYEWPCPLSGSAAYSDDQCEVTALNAFCGKGRLFNALAKYAPAPYDSMNIRWPHYFERHDADGTLLNRYVFGLNAQNKLIYFDLDAPSVISVTDEDVTYANEPVFIDYNYNGKDYLLINGGESGFFVFDGEFVKAGENPLVTGAALFDGKLFACSTENYPRVKYMAPAAPGAWSNNFSSLLVYNECGKAKNLAALKNYIYVFQEKGISRISSAQSDNYSVAKMWESGEELYGGTVRVAGDEIWFFTSRGLYRFDGGSVKAALPEIYAGRTGGKNSRLALFDGKIYAATALDEGEDTEANNALLVMDVSGALLAVYTGVDIRSFCTFGENRLMACFGDGSVAFLTDADQEGAQPLTLQPISVRVRAGTGGEGAKYLVAVKTACTQLFNVTVTADGKTRSYTLDGSNRARFVRDGRRTEAFDVTVSAAGGEITAPVLYYSEEM